METALPPLETLVREALAARYAAPVVRLEGAHVEVLGGKALELARAHVRAAGYEDAEAAVRPLDPSRRPWLAVPAGGLQLWRQHGALDDEGELVTEFEAGDPPVRALAEFEEWQLVQGADGATGWLAPEHAPALLAGPPAAAPAMRADGNLDPDAVVREVQALMGTPYVWGGTTARGMDCSGLVQRAVWRAGGVWLPRHSTALLEVGERVAPSAVQRGDVLVLRRKPVDPAAPAPAREPLPPHGGPAVHPMHVAVAVSAEGAVHASRDAWQVIAEPLDSLRERYRVLGVRRLGGTG